MSALGTDACPCRCHSARQAARTRRAGGCTSPSRSKRRMARSCPSCQAGEPGPRQAAPGRRPPAMRESGPIPRASPPTTGYEATTPGIRPWSQMRGFLNRPFGRRTLWCTPTGPTRRDSSPSPNSKARRPIWLRCGDGRRAGRSCSVPAAAAAAAVAAAAAPRDAFSSAGIRRCRRTVPRHSSTLGLRCRRSRRRSDRRRPRIRSLAHPPPRRRASPMPCRRRSVFLPELERYAAKAGQRNGVQEDAANQRTYAT
mmetsp:Transcript_3200/g.8855  ORF Transcript_3200/g.8855 Transcript_3200/m.8855 type:complete len:255 (-) Transcript_3200:185-949(-)